MLGAILKSIGGGLIDKLIDPFTDLFKAYLNKEISKEELRTRLLQSLLATAGDIEKAHSESLAKTYQAFMDAAVKSPPMARAWAIVVYSQLAVLLWHQVGIPAVVFFGWKYPSSGTTVDWAYALIFLCLGGGAIALRTGPAKLNVEGLKNLIAR